MALKDDLMEAKNELQELKKQSFAKELLVDLKRQNKRQFVIILVILSMWFLTIGYLVYIMNDIGVEKITTTETNTQEVHDIDSIDNSYIINGDNNGNN